MVDAGVSAWRHGELAEQAGADAHDHREHQHLDTGRDHIAQDLLGQERGLVPQREGHQHKARERGQLELDQCHEKLHREDEEAHDQYQPRQEQHGDHVEVGEHLREARQITDLRHDRAARVDAHLRQASGLQQLSLRQA